MAKKKTDEKGKLPRGKLAITKDPRVYEQNTPRTPQGHKRLLGLDLASNCGATFCDIIPGLPVTGGQMIAGQWDLEVGKWDTQAIRLIRLKQFLSIAKPDLVFYEEVKFVGQSPAPGARRQNLTALVARAVSGAQVVHIMQGCLVTWCEERDIPCQHVPIGVLKKYATGRGNANKLDMIRACNEQFGTEFREEEGTGDDNIADSMFLCAMAVANYSEGLA